MTRTQHTPGDLPSHQSANDPGQPNIPDWWTVSPEDLAPCQSRRCSVDHNLALPLNLG